VHVDSGARRGASDTALAFLETFRIADSPPRKTFFALSAARGSKCEGGSAEQLRQDQSQIQTSNKIFTLGYRSTADP
jgi:hypothetical protein